MASLLTALAAHVRAQVRNGADELDGSAPSDDCRAGPCWPGLCPMNEDKLRELIDVALNDRMGAPSESTRSRGSPRDINKEGDGLLTTAEVARLLHCHERTLRRWCKAGVVPPPVRVGSVVRWRRAELEKWVSERKAAS